MPKHHLIISGTGRAGTTFLMQLLTELGLDTGFHGLNDDIQSESNAGMERNFWEENLPYVLKSPSFCEHLEKFLATGDVKVDCAIIPIRELFAAAESRRDVSRRTQKRKARGGLWLTKNPRRQEAALATQFHNLVHTLAKYDVPMIWLHFPRLVTDVNYLFEKMKPLLPEKNFATFEQAFQKVSRPELVHNFQQKIAEKKSLLGGIKKLFNF